MEMEVDSQIGDKLKSPDCSVSLCRYDLVKLSDLLQKTNTSVKTNNNTVQSCETPCQACGKLYFDQKKLENHIEYIHENKKKKKVSFSDHVIVYDAPNYHKCKKCPRVFIKYEDFKNHIKTEHKKRKCYLCCHCKLEFVDRAVFKVHIKLHCSTCGKLLTNKDELLYHRQNACQDAGLPVRILQCKICCKFFSTLHMKYNTKEMSYQCDICSRDVNKALLINAITTSNEAFDDEFSKISNLENKLVIPTLDTGNNVMIIPSTDKSVIDMINEIKVQKFNIKNEIPIFFKPRVVLRKNFNMVLSNVHSLGNVDVNNKLNNRTLDGTGNVDILKTNAKSKDISSNNTAVSNFGTLTTNSDMNNGLENNGRILNEDFVKNIINILPDIDSPNYQRTITILNSEMDTNIEPNNKISIGNNDVPKTRRRPTISPHKCKYCSKCYISAYTLRRHLDTMHTTYNGELQCKVCNLCFPSKHLLQQHAKEHRKSAPKTKYLSEPRSEMHTQQYSYKPNEITNVLESESVLANLLSPRAGPPSVMTRKNPPTYQEHFNMQMDRAVSQNGPRAMPYIVRRRPRIFSKTAAPNAVVVNGTPRFPHDTSHILKRSTQNTAFENEMMQHNMLFNPLGHQNLPFQNRPYHMMASNARAQNVAFQNRQHLPIDQMMASNIRAAFQNRQHLPMDQMMASNIRAQNLAFQNRQHLPIEYMMTPNARENAAFQNTSYPPMVQIPDILLCTQENVMLRNVPQHTSKAHALNYQKAQPQTIEVPVEDGDNVVEIPCVDGDNVVEIPCVNGDNVVEIPSADGDNIVEIPCVDGDNVVEIPCVDGDTNNQSWSNAFFDIQMASPNQKYQLVATEVPIEF